MNKLLKYGLYSLMGFSLAFTACNEEKSDLRQEAENLKNLYDKIDQSAGMTQKQKADFKALTANSEFEIGEETVHQGPGVMSDKIITGYFVKNGDTVTTLTLQKTYMVFDQESQSEDDVLSSTTSTTKIEWKGNSLVEDKNERKYVDGHRTGIARLHFVPNSGQ